MGSKVFILSEENTLINSFLQKFYNSSIPNSQQTTFWKKTFSNPLEIAELAAAYTDNSNFHKLNMWISLDKNIFIKISPSNVDIIIKYLFERYPY